MPQVFIKLHQWETYYACDTGVGHIFLPYVSLTVNEMAAAFNFSPAMFFKVYYEK